MKCKTLCAEPRCTEMNIGYKCEGDGDGKELEGAKSHMECEQLCKTEDRSGCCSFSIKESDCRWYIGATRVNYNSTESSAAFCTAPRATGKLCHRTLVNNE